MQTTTYALPPSDGYPFYITANRYHSRRWDERSATDADSLTLIVLHSTSFHKEIWEPTLAHLVRLTNLSEDGSVTENQSRKRCRTVSVRDIWAIECPNHGASAELNLRGRNGSADKPTNFSCAKYAEAVHHFLNVAPHHPKGPKVDFRKRSLVGIGHSLGANAMLLLQAIQPQFNFSCLVIVEPMVSAIGRQPLESLRKRLVSQAERRTNVWRSREEAWQSLSSKRHWDPRVLDVFVKHGLYWAPELNRYTTHCSRDQEKAMYEDIEGPTKPVDVLQEICHKVPVHLILGELHDFIPLHVHQALVDPSSGRRFASIQWIPNTGHLIPQEQPSELAKCIFDALSSRPPLHRL